MFKDLKASWFKGPGQGPGGGRGSGGNIGRGRSGHGERCLVLGLILQCPHPMTVGVARHVFVLLPSSIKRWGFHHIA